MSDIPNVLVNVLLVLLGGAIVPAVIGVVQKRIELKRAAPKADAEAESIGREADGQTIIRLGRENERLSTRAQRADNRADESDDRVDALEKRADASEARERALVEAMHRWIVWAGQVTEIASHHDLQLPPPPMSPIQDSGATK